MAGVEQITLSYTFHETTPAAAETDTQPSGPDA